MAASSPCVRLCVIDDRSGQCRGCGRTLAEIAGWGSFGEPQRQAVMATLEERLRLAGDLPGPSVGPGRAGKPGRG